MRKSDPQSTHVRSYAVSEGLSSLAAVSGPDAFGSLFGAEGAGVPAARTVVLASTRSAIEMQVLQTPSLPSVSSCGLPQTTQAGRAGGRIFLLVFG